jgi:hypothetical protein
LAEPPRVVFCGVLTPATRGRRLLPSGQGDGEGTQGSRNSGAAPLSSLSPMWTSSRFRSRKRLNASRPAASSGLSPSNY